MANLFSKPLALILFSSLLFINCSSDDFFDQSKSDQILGTWDVKFIQDGSDSSYPSTAVLEFRKNGTVAVSDEFSIVLSGIQDYAVSFEEFTTNDPIGKRDVLTIADSRFLIEIGSDNDSNPVMNMIHYGYGEGKIEYSLSRR